MIIAIEVARQDSNSEDFLLVSWLMPDLSQVRKGQVVCLAETQKTVIEVEAPCDGVLVQLLPESHRGRFNAPVAAVGKDEPECLGWRDSMRSAPAKSEVAATRKAKSLAERHGIDLAEIVAQGIVGEKEVEDHLRAKGLLGNSWGHPGDLASPRRRVLVIGAGLGAMQAVDILLNDPLVEVVGCLDDDTSLAAVRILGAPVLGTVSIVGELWKRGAFDQAVVAVSNDVHIRRRLFLACKEHGIPMANAIDPTARIQRGAKLGEGNVICAHCHVGVGASLGDNNFLSAYCSAEHHTRWGSHISTGPGCLTSALVEVGDLVRLGTGIFLEPGASLGEGSVVASGAVFGGHLKPGHILKVSTRTQAIPLDRGGAK